MFLARSMHRGEPEPTDVRPGPSRGISRAGNCASNRTIMLMHDQARGQQPSYTSIATTTMRHILIDNAIADIII